MNPISSLFFTTSQTPARAAAASSGFRRRATTFIAGLGLAALVQSAPAAAQVASAPGPATESAAPSLDDTTPEPQKPKPSKRAAKYELRGQLNITTATADQWQMFPGIGPSIAAKIVAHRETQPFVSIDDLLQVRGIGRKTLERIRMHLALDGQSNLERVPAASPG